MAARRAAAYIACMSAITTDLPWQQLAIYAAGAALVLILLFKIPYVGRILRALFSFALLAFGIFLVLQHAPFDPNLSRIAASLGLDRQEVVGDEVRIPMARDGHFWATVRLDGAERRMLVDSGATVTALSEATAKAAGVEADVTLMPLLMRTANGTVRAAAGTVERLEIGGIEARRLKVVISPGLGDTDVLGMNFLSELSSWRVEGRTLILVPKMKDKAA
jgi:aspartyl protease family protein